MTQGSQANQARIDAMRPEDWPDVREIFRQGIETGLATFETSTPEWAEWDSDRCAVCRLVAREEGRVVGWATLAGVSSRACYRGVAEVSVYVAEGARGRGVGARLLEALVDCSERAGFWTLQAAVFPENAASLSLLEKAGFRVVGVRERIGRLDGVWRDTVLLERRRARDDS